MSKGIHSAPALARIRLEVEGGAGLGGTGPWHLAPATPPASKVRHPGYFLPNQRNIHIVDSSEVKYREDTRLKGQLEASKQQHCDLCRCPSRSSVQVTFHTILLGVGGVIYTPSSVSYTLEPLKELGLHNHTAIKLALKLCAHSVHYACKIVSTKHALEKTPLTSRNQDQARATASNPPDPHRVLSFVSLGEGDASALGILFP
eukprot:1137111-Pelagomonas_calceolata.AAC.2